MLQEIHNAIDAVYPEMLETRRYLHQYPELSFKEFKTAKYIADFYEKIGIPYQKNVGGNGIVATLKGRKPGKTIALRADFDALPIQDEKDVPYKSKIDGVMHACGHDGHTSTLLYLAKVMKSYQEELPGTIVFLHQHAEEYAPGGAKPMIDAGALKDVDAVFGTHLWATTPLGFIQTAKGVLMAGADRFEIVIQGQGGHGAYPHETKDSIVIGSQIVTQLQQIISRRLDPLETAVITVGIFEAGNAFNIIADTARLIGTVRYLNTEIQDRIIKEMEKIIKGICIANGCNYTFNYEKGYPPVINHDKEAELVMKVSQKLAEVETVEEIIPVMGGEDFAYYLLEKPGAFFFTGAEKEGNRYPHHHPHFDFDERAMPIAAKTLISAYYAYQEE
ncbi:M20 metallopeptidase family protein [Ornithinibacillus bavariensis]|uniref:Amidohydrolase YhaA n=1 Tax=Ornithinibacillus bavariensis TaxID=545502 RepID=A0A919X6Y7_9BACI|nr:M20 family metallopeptidase [Ornithinibacillus bavariensis]GIO25695.1 putative amidohydrolase YhaA [Ornithinibacillus bavariensis]